MPLVAVVDDEEPVRRSAERLLRSAGNDAALFPGGAELFTWLDRGERPGCVLVDLHMPGMDGMEVLSRLSRRDDAIPAIVVSGRGSPPDRQMAAGLGAVGFFAKPYDPDKLLAAIEAAVAGAGG